MSKKSKWTLGENKPNQSQFGNPANWANQRYPVLFSFSVYYLWLYLYINFQTQDMVNFINQNYEGQNELLTYQKFITNHTGSYNNHNDFL